MHLNKSSLVYSKRNSTTASSKNDVSSSNKPKKKKVECRTCHNIFNMDVSIYTGHQTGGKCPNYGKLYPKRETQNNK